MTFTGELTGRFQDHGSIILFEINRGIEDDLLGAEKVWVAVDHRPARDLLGEHARQVAEGGYDEPIVIEYEAWQMVNSTGSRTGLLEKPDSELA